MKYWNKIWPYGLVLLIIAYIIETLTYGALSQKLFILLFPLSFSWIGIKKLRNKNK